MAEARDRKTPSGQTGGNSRELRAPSILPGDQQAANVGPAAYLAKAQKRRGYTRIPNGLLPEREKKISARSWGIYAYLLSRPPGWEVRARHLATVFTEGRDAIYKSLKELVAAGLMELETYLNEDGLPRKRYVLVDRARIFNSPNPDFPDPGNQDPDFQDPENPAGIITEVITNEDTTKTEKKHLQASRVVGPQALSNLGPQNLGEILEEGSKNWPEDFFEQHDGNGPPPF